MINDSSTTENKRFAKFNSTDDRLDKFYFHTLTLTDTSIVEKTNKINSHFELRTSRFYYEKWSH